MKDKRKTARSFLKGIYAGQMLDNSFYTIEKVLPNNQKLNKLYIQLYYI